MGHSSSGPGHRPLKAEIAGSNPACPTKALCSVTPWCLSEPGESFPASRFDVFEALGARVPSYGGHQGRDFQSQHRAGVSARRQEAGPPPGFLVWEASEAGHFGDGAA